MTRLIKQIVIGTLFLSCLLPAVASERPNILLIFTDDQRFDSIGYENPEVLTPNLDKLAKHGVIFNNCFVNTSSVA